MRTPERRRFKNLSPMITGEGLSVDGDGDGVLIMS